MLLYYAVGGGLGHLTRAAAIIDYLKISAKDMLLLTASPFAQIYFPDLQILSLPKHLQNNPDFYEIWLQQQCRKYNFTEIWIDSFPCGILGELHCLQEFDLRATYLARILDWKNYKGLMKHSPNFQRVWQLEGLEEEHQRFVDTLSCPSEAFVFDYPKKVAKKQLFDANDWLIVHSEPAHEVEELLAYAYEQAKMEKLTPRFCVISPIKKLDTIIDYTHFNLYPAYPYFYQAGRIFTACGFNSMKQAEEFSHKHQFLPFRRRFDNQFLRASLVLRQNK
ncbi:MAG: hypothetical protein OHK0045_13090 [Raineya sp.]